MNTENISGMFIVFRQITCETLKPQKTNGFVSHITDLVLHLFRKTSRFHLHLNLQEFRFLFFLSESHIHKASEKRLCDHWPVAAAL